VQKSGEISWLQYNEQTKKNPPRSLLLKSLELFNEYKGNAIDIGCGVGNESVFLYDNGWDVLAVDKNTEGLNNLQRKYPKIQILNNSFEDLNELPKSDLVFSIFSIPFCVPQYFDKFIDVLLKCIKSNGRFAGNFFGLNDEWANSHTNMTFCSVEKVKSLFDNFFEIEYFSEVEFNGKKANGEDKYWHTIDNIEKKI
jgi:trans-aconitate methyltransferase